MDRRTLLVGGQGLLAAPLAAEGHTEPNLKDWASQPPLSNGAKLERVWVFPEAKYRDSFGPIQFHRLPRFPNRPEIETYD